MTRAVAIDLDGALGDTRPLWRAFLADAARRFSAVAPLDGGRLPEDRAAAAESLDHWAEAGIGDWRKALERFAEDHAPVYLRPDASATAALRTLAAARCRLVVFTDAPEPLARVALAHLGASRRVHEVQWGAGALERAKARLGPRAEVVETAEDLVRLADACT